MLLQLCPGGGVTGFRPPEGPLPFPAPGNSEHLVCSRIFIYWVLMTRIVLHALCSLCHWTFVIIVKLDSIIIGPFKWWKSGGHLPKMRGHLPKIIQVIGTKPRFKPSSGLFQSLGPLTYSICCQLYQVVSKISSEERAHYENCSAITAWRRTCFSVWSRPSLSASVASFVNVDGIFLVCTVIVSKGNTLTAWLIILENRSLWGIASYIILPDA